MYLYMKTTTDKYELPIAVADTPRELAKMLDISANTVRTCLCRGIYGYKKIEITKEEAESWGREGRYGVRKNRKQ